MEFFFHSLTPFLPLFYSCQFRRLDTIKFLCSQAHIPAGWRLEARPFTSDSATLLFFWTLLHNHVARTTQKTQPLLLRRRVYWPVAWQWTSYCCGVRFRGDVFTESFPSSGSIRHSINMKAYFGIQVIVLIDRYNPDPYFAHKFQWGFTPTLISSPTQGAGTEKRETEG
jgi:hypothetical protein